MSRMGDAIGRAFTFLNGLCAGPVFAFCGQDIPCVVGILEKQKRLGHGGFEPEADLLLYVNKSDLPDESEPEETCSISYKGRTYIIDKIAEMPGGDQVRYALIDPEMES